MDMDRRILGALLAIGLSACGASATGGQPSATLPPCQSFDPPPPIADAEIQHLKTAATVIQVTSVCTVRVSIAGGGGTLATFANREIVLRATSRTTFVSASPGDLEAIGRFGLKAGDVFTLSFDGRPFSDGSYPINGMNR
jgi:hypothetical protein